MTDDAPLRWRDQAVPGQTSGPIFNPEQARQWGEEWRLKHAGRWRKLDGGGYIPSGGEPMAQGETRQSASREIILLMEREINCGRQLSTAGYTRGR